MDDFSSGEFYTLFVTKRSLSLHTWRPIPRWDNGALEAVRFVNDRGGPIFPGYVHVKHIESDVIDMIYIKLGVKKQESQNGNH